MKLQRHDFQIKTLLFNYLIDRKLDVLIVGLSKLENDLHRNTENSKPNQSLWFKFGSISYDIKDIVNDLHYQPKNKDLLIESFQEVLSIKGEATLKVYFS
jgi:hypothetical protein